MRGTETAGRLRYFTIAEEIRRRIASGSYTYETALPSQASLAEEFDTTVMTVRQALKTLEMDGLIETRHGVGSFVTGLNEDHREFTLSSFRQALGSHAAEVVTEVIFRRRRTDCTAASRALEAGGTTVSAIGRRRSIRSTVLVFQVSYVVGAYSDVLFQYRPGHSLYAALNAYLDTVITQADERITAIGAPDAVALELSVAPGAPCLFSERVSKDAAGRPVLFDQAYMRSDAVELSLHRNGKSAYPTYLIHDKENS